MSAFALRGFGIEFYNVFISFLCFTAVIYVMETINPCCCCLFRPPEKNLKTPYVHLGITEIYSNMIEKCFAIRLTLGNDDECGICSMCVGRLRDACDFKLQVQRSQAELQARLEEKAYTTGDEPAFASVIVDGDVTNEEYISYDEVSVKTELVKKGGESEECILYEEPPISSEFFVEVGYSDDMLAVEPSVKSESSDDVMHDDTVGDLLVPLYDAEAAPEDPAQALPDSVKAQLAMACVVRLERLRDDKAPHACHKCSKTFDHEAILATHMRVHAKQERNRKCLRQDLGQTYYCETCKKRFKRKCNKKKQLKRNGALSSQIDSKFMCSKCISERYMNMRGRGRPSEVFFINKSDSDAHRSLLKTPKLFACKVCKKRFQEKMEFQRHVHAHKNRHIHPYKCDVCYKSYKLVENFIRHKDSHIKNYTCEECGKQFENTQDLNTHKRITHETRQLHTCDICKVHCMSMYELFLHIRSHTGNKPFSCEDCAERFSYRIDLIQHRRIHTGEIC